MMKRILPALCAIAMLATNARASARPLTYTDLPSIVGVSSASISPDGKTIAYIISRANMKADRNDATLELYDLATETSRALTYNRRAIASPAWSPDGTHLAFLSLAGDSDDASQQIFVMDMRGGEPTPVTTAPLGVEQFAWRPDGAAIAFVTADEPHNKKEIAHHLDAFVVGDQAFNERSAPTPNHIWLATRGDGDRWTAKRLTSGAWSIPSAQPPSSPGAPISWSPDGTRIIFTKMSNAYDADSDLATTAVLDVTSGAIHTLTSHQKFEGFAEFSPDGKSVSYWYPFGGDPAAENDIFITSANGGDGTDFTATDIDTNVQRALWMPDGSLLISGHKGTDAALWVKPLNGAAKRLNLGNVQPTQAFWLDASVSSTGAIAFTGTEAHHPSELYYMASPTATPKRLTSYNDAVAGLDLGTVTSIDWSAEGFNEDGVVTLPPHYDASKKYPLVLVIHGGPNSASITSFSSLNQLLAAHGYIVFNPNYRGSDNLGEAYWHAIANDSGAGPGRDVMAGLNAVERTYPIDTSRIAISGWSYGGYMTSWMIGHYHLWKTAVSGAAVNNLVDEYALGDNGVQDRYTMGGSPYVKNNLQAYIDQSPITYAWQITTPTLILSDVNDQRVPITQSYEMYRALKDRGTPVQFWAYPVSGHFPSDPVRALDVNRRWVEWIANALR